MDIYSEFLCSMHNTEIPVWSEIQSRWVRMYLLEIWSQSVSSLKFRGPKHHWFPSKSNISDKILGLQFWVRLRYSGVVFYFHFFFLEYATSSYQPYPCFCWCRYVSLVPLRTLDVHHHWRPSAIPHPRSSSVQWKGGTFWQSHLWIFYLLLCRIASSYHVIYTSIHQRCRFCVILSVRKNIPLYMYDNYKWSWQPDA